MFRQRQPEFYGHGQYTSAVPAPQPGRITSAELKSQVRWRPQAFRNRLEAQYRGHMADLIPQWQRLELGVVALLDSKGSTYQGKPPAS